MTRLRALIRPFLASFLVILGAAYGAQALAGDAVAEGKAIATDRKKGNCMSCHMMGDATLPGNIGPPLVAMKARFPDKAKLRAQVWDATKANPHSLMPPFGKHGILSDSDIDKIVEYILTL